MLPPPSTLAELATAVQQSQLATSSPILPLVRVGVFTRIAAALLDLLFFALAAMALTILILMIDDFDGHPLNRQKGDCVLNLLILLSAAAYLSSNALFQRSPGKAMLGLKIISPDEQFSRDAVWKRWFLQSLPLFAAAAISTGMLFRITTLTYSTFPGSFTPFEHRVCSYTVPVTFAAFILTSFLPTGSGWLAWYERATGTFVARPSSINKVRGFEAILHK